MAVLFTHVSDLQERVADLDIVTYETEEAERPGGGAIFPDPSRGHKYYMQQVAVQDIAGRSATPIAATMQLEWTGALENPEKIREVRCDAGISHVFIGYPQFFCA